MSAPWQAVWLLAGEVAAVVVLTSLIAWRLRSVVWQRTLWQAGLIAVLGLLVVEFSSLSLKRKTETNSQVLTGEFQMEDRMLSWTVVPLDLKPGDLELRSAVPMQREDPAEQQMPPVDLPPIAEVAMDSQVTESVAATPVAATETTSTDGVKQTFPLMLAVALGVWIVGSAVLAMRLFVGRILLLKFCARSQTVAEKGLFRRVQGIADKLGLKQAVRVLETELIQAPVVFGLFRPSIALPVGFAARFQPKQQEAILAHELAHLGARDPLWYLLADALASVLWWHPLVWVARARLHVASELAADEACVLAEQGPATLAECLVTIAQEMHGPGTLESIGIEGSGFRSRLGQRVERLLQLSAEMVSKPALWRTRLVKVGMPVLLLSLLVLGSGWMRKDESAPWSGVVEGAWQKATGALQTAEANIRRDPRPVLLAAATTGEANDKVAVTESGNQKLNEATRKKLEEVKLKEMFFDGLPLEITLKFLAEESIKNDTQKQGIKMVWRGNVPYVPPPDGRPRLNAAGLPVIPPDSGEYNMNRPLEELPVLVNPPKKNLSYKQVVEAVCEGALWPLTYQIEDGVVVFTAKPLAKLDAIKLKQATLDRMPLVEVVRFLNEESRKLDTNGQGVKFKVEGKFQLANGGDADAEMTLVTREIPDETTLRQALDMIMAAAEHPIEYQEKDGEVILRPKEGTPLLKQPERVVISQARVAQITSKLKGIVIPQLQMKRVPLEQALVQLEREAKAADLEGDGLKIGLQEPLKALLADHPMLVTIEPPLLKVTLADALEAVTVAARDGNGTVLVQALTQDGPTVGIVPRHPGWQRVYRVDIAEWVAELERGAGRKLNPPWDADLALTVDKRNVMLGALSYQIRDYLQQKHIVFSKSKEGTTLPIVRIHDRVSMITVTGEMEQLEQVDKLWGTLRLQAGTSEGLTHQAQALPVPNPYVRTNGPQTTTKSRQRILAKLDQMVIKELYFDGVPLADVVKFLQEESVKLDPELKGINFIINSHLDDQPSNAKGGNDDLENTIIKINPPLKNLRMIDALDAITKIAARNGGQGLSYMVEEYAVVFRRTTANPVHRFTRIFKTDPNTFRVGLESVAGIKIEIPTAASTSAQTGAFDEPVETNTNKWAKELQTAARDFFREKGVNLSTNAVVGTSSQIVFNDKTGGIIGLGSLEELGTIQKWITTITEAAEKGGTAAKEVANVAKETPDSRDSSKQAKEPAKTITRMLPFDPEALVKGLEKLTGKSVEALTETALAGKVPANEAEGITNRVTTRVAQIFSLAEQYFAEQGADMSKVTISPLFKIVPYELKGMMPVRASEADMDIIQKSLDKIMAAGKLQPQSRVFQLQNESATNIVRAIRGSFTSTLSTAIADVPGNKLIVKAPTEDMQRVEEFIQRLDAPGSGKGREERVTKVFKVGPDSVWNGFREMMATSGFASTNMQEMMREFMLRSGVRLSESNTNGTVILLNERTGVLLARATPKEMEIIQSAIEVMNIVPPQISIEAQYVEVPEKVAEEMGLKWFANGLPPDKSKLSSMIRVESLSKTNESGMHIDAPQVPNHVSILSPAQARELQARLAKAPGINRLSAPRVTTMNKRQAQIAVVDTATIVVGRTNRLVKGEAGQKDTEEPVFITDQLAMGPVLDVIPSVYPDGKSMQLDWVFSLTEFLGYDKPEKKDELPEPQVRTRYVSNQNVIQDGYTLVAGCGMADVEVKTDGKKGWFRSKHPKTEKKMVLILMTATLIDAAGNAVNSDR